jgi:hypothetical protein
MRVVVFLPYSIELAVPMRRNRGAARTGVTGRSRKAERKGGRE